MTVVHDQEVETARPHRVAERSTGQLFRDLTREIVILFRQEVGLAKKEMSEKASCVGRNVGYLAAGGLVAFAGALVLLGALSAGLFTALWGLGMVWWHAMWLAPLIVGLIVGLIGYAFVQKSITTLKHTSPVPRETVDSLKENKEWLKHEVM